MKKLALLALGLFAVTSYAQVYVDPYVKRDGTFVEGHLRSNPNSTREDNYSTRGNSNPYTGQEGTKDSSRGSSYGTDCSVNSKGHYVCR